MSDAIRLFLASLKLEQYADSFLQQGYDDPSCLKSIDEGDLDAMGITLPGHRKRILQNAATWTPGSTASPVPSSPSSTPNLATPSSSSASLSAAPAPLVAEPAAPPPTTTEDAAPPVPTRPRPLPNPPARPPSTASLGAGAPAVPPRSEKPPPALPVKATSPVPVAAPTVPTSTPAAAQAPAPSPLSKRVSSAPDSMASPVVEESEQSLIPLDIVTEATGVLSIIRVSRHVTAKQALDKFLASVKLQRTSPNSVWQFCEVFETPPVDRQLEDDEPVLDAKLAWPKVEGCRFEVREVPPELIGVAHPTVQGKLDKRGGSHKSWKTRHFILQPDKDLAYYVKTPKAKEMDSPIGTFELQGGLVFNIRNLKKAPRPDLCFCIKPSAPCLWPGDSKEKIMDHFEESCRFMCAFTPEERVTWIASIRRGIKESKFSEGQGAVRPSTPNESSDEEEDKKKEEKKEEKKEDRKEEVEVEPAPPALAARPLSPPVALPTMPAPRERPEPAPRKKMPDGGVPEDFVPIKPKPVMGVGFGNVLAALPKRPQAE